MPLVVGGGGCLTLPYIEFQPVVLCLAPPVPLAFEGVRSLRLSPALPLLALTFPHWLHPLLFGNLFPTFSEVGFLARGCFLSLLVSEISWLWLQWCFEREWRQMSVRLLCLMESAHKFSNEQLRRGKNKTSMVINSSCFIAFQVQLFVKRNLNKRIMVGSSCLYSPHNVSTSKS